MRSLGTHLGWTSVSSGNGTAVTGDPEVSLHFQLWFRGSNWPGRRVACVPGEKGGREPRSWRGPASSLAILRVLFSRSWLLAC